MSEKKDEKKEPRDEIEASNHAHYLPPQLSSSPLLLIMSGLCSCSSIRVQVSPCISARTAIEPD